LINDSRYGNIIRDARNEMEYRGSKSEKFVKEQRVDGSSVNKTVRCTLVTGKPVLRRKIKIKVN
jgi:hypothetical protein